MSTLSALQTAPLLMGAFYSSTASDQSSGTLPVQDSAAEVTRSMPADPAVLASELVNSLRTTTGLDYNLSRTSVMMLLQALSEGLSLHDVLLPVICALDNNVPTALLESSHDANRLNKLLRDVTSRKEDYQQRNWHLHDDKEHIEKNLAELLSILRGADPALCVRTLLHAQSQALDNLVLYYQMETRGDLRLQLLPVYAAIVELGDRVLAATLLASVLPLELAAEITNWTDEERALESAALLTQLLSTSEQMPRTHYGVLNESFVEFLLDKIEGGEEQLSDALMFLLLSFNQHMEAVESNLVIQALLKRSEATNLTEKTLILFNRDDEAVSIGTAGYKVPLASATTKFLMDLFANEETANLFYTNDTNVLIDILVRQIHDLPSTDAKRTKAMSLMLLVVRNTDYASNRHKQRELEIALGRILATETNSPQELGDVKLAAEIRASLAVSAITGS